MEQNPFFTSVKRQTSSHIPGWKRHMSHLIQQVTSVVGGVGEGRTFKRQMMPLEDNDTKVCGNTTRTSGPSMGLASLPRSNIEDKLTGSKYTYPMTDPWDWQVFLYRSNIKVNQTKVNILYMDPMGIDQIFWNKNGTEIA